MKTIHFLMASCLFFAPLATTVSAQDDSPYSLEADFSLKRYSPQYVGAVSLYSTLDSMYGREIIFEDRMVMNLTVLDDSVVIYETTERLKRILEAIDHLDVDGYKDLEEENESSDSYRATELILESYLPNNFKVEELYDLATDLYGRQLYVDGSWYRNLRATNAAVLVYEEASAAKRILEQLAYLDSSQAPKGETELTLFEYKPRHVSASGLLDGVRPFIANVGDSRGNNRSTALNISLMHERGLIIVRDVPNRAKEIMETLKRLDQPAPQVMVVCQILRGVNHDTDQPAADDLQKELRQLLPHENYEVVANGMLRGSTIMGTALELKMMTAVDDQYNLRMRGGAYDQETGALNVDDCSLMLFDPNSGNHELFHTSTTIHSGEYAVLGVTGAEPLFLVVQLHPVKAPQ